MPGGTTDRGGPPGPLAGMVAAVTAICILVTAACSDGDTTGGDGGDGGDTSRPAPAEAGPDGGAEGGGVADPTAVELVDQGLDLDEPIDLVTLPDSDVVLLAERAGRVRAAAAGPGGLRLRDEPVLDLGGLVSPPRGERGLLGLEVSPEGDELYVNYTGADDGETRVEAFTLEGSAEQVRADRSSRRELIVIDQPFANHNGGDLAVDADGMLYVPTGDGGAGGDPDGRAQDPDSLLGKVLRLDPKGAADSDGDGIPDDNPFTEGGARPEIWAVGLRNPWRVHLDRADGSLWVADVGQDRREEVSVVRPEGGVAAGAGANFGWDLFEGDERFDDADPSELSEGPLVEPVLTYGRDEGECSISGGVVVHDPALPALEGAYLFGDLCRPGVRALPADRTGFDSVVELDDSLPGVVSFGTGPRGEIYVLSLEAGVHRLVAA